MLSRDEIYEMLNKSDYYEVHARQLAKNQFLSPIGDYSKAVELLMSANEEQTEEER